MYGKYPQKATYWTPPTPDVYGGESFADPQIVDCRWEERTERILDQQGNDAISEAQVFLRFKPVLGGYLYLGEAGGSDTPESLGARVIERVDSVPDLRNLHQTHKAYL